MDSPNVLLLDEPTNDFDIETLTELEDLLDSYGGTILVISHDRYFLERVCDRFVGLLGDGQLRDLPRGVNQYLEQREAMITDVNNTQAPTKRISNAAQERQLKKDLARVERQIEKAAEKHADLLREQEASSFDAPRLLEIASELALLQANQATLDEEWLATTLALGN